MNTSEKKHIIPLGQGWVGVFTNCKEMHVTECKAHETATGKNKPYICINNGSYYDKLSMTLEDAQALCFVLFDLTQPLRDARDAADQSRPA